MIITGFPMDNCGKRILEVACFSSDAALIAVSAGAHRIELCKDYRSGGITPPPENIKRIKTTCEVPLFVMIRPRAGNFNYNRKEFEDMMTAIEEGKKLGVNGFVFGILTPGHELNLEQCARLTQIAAPLPCTLHRAFDFIKDKQKAINQAIEAGFARVLTSGGSGNFYENLTALEEIVKLASNKIIIIAGGGLRSQNAHMLNAIMGLKEIHSSAIIDKKKEIPDPGEIHKILTFLN